MSSTTLKFNAESFKELDAPNLIINLWSYSDYLKKNDCEICRKYCDLSLNALSEKWQKDWGPFNYIMSKVKKNDRLFLNVGKYPSADRYLIIDFLKEIEKGRKILYEGNKYQMFL